MEFVLEKIECSNFEDKFNSKIFNEKFIIDEFEKVVEDINEYIIDV